MKPAILLRRGLEGIRATYGMGEMEQVNLPILQQEITHLFDDALVRVEVESQLGVVLLDDDSGGLLDRLGADATHGDSREESGEPLDVLLGTRRQEKEGNKQLKVAAAVS